MLPASSEALASSTVTMGMSSSRIVAHAEASPTVAPVTSCNTTLNISSNSGVRSYCASHTRKYVSVWPAVIVYSSSPLNGL